jgi:hypothetical protein
MTKQDLSGSSRHEVIRKMEVTKWELIMLFRKLNFFLGHKIKWRVCLSDYLRYNKYLR